MRTRVGYAGGTTPHPTYGNIGDHTESIQIDFDPKVISYEHLLELFWSEHDPCSRSFSTQYKAALWVHSPAQRKVAEETQRAFAAKAGKAVLTQILDFKSFTRAEDYHQKFYLRQYKRIAKEVLARTSDGDAFTDSTIAARLDGYLGHHGTPEQFERDLPRLGLSKEAQTLLRERFLRR